MCCHQMFREATSTGWADVHADVVDKVAAQLGDDEALVRASLRRERHAVRAARVLFTGARPTYRIREADLRHFCATYILEDSRGR